MIYPTAFFAGVILGGIIGAPIGWALKTAYLRSLHRMAIRIRTIQRGGKIRRRRH